MKQKVALELFWIFKEKVRWTYIWGVIPNERFIKVLQSSCSHHNGIRSILAQYVTLRLVRKQVC